MFAFLNTLIRISTLLTAGMEMAGATSSKSLLRKFVRMP